MTTARIEFTKDTRNGTPTRRAKEIANATPEKVERAQARLEEQNAYNFAVLWELARD